MKIVKKNLRKSKRVFIFLEGYVMINVIMGKNLDFV